MKRETAIRQFRKHWTFLSKFPCDKDSYLPSEDWLFNCALCEYVQPVGKVRACTRCPIKWPILINKDPEHDWLAKNTYQCELSLYRCWVWADDPLSRKMLAKAISMLPEKKAEVAKK